MSALGQKRTCAAQKAMSALPPKADICSAALYVRFGPKADMCGALAHVRYVPLTSDLRLDAPQQSSLRYSMRPAAAYAI